MKLHLSYINTLIWRALLSLNSNYISLHFIIVGMYAIVLPCLWAHKRPHVLSLQVNYGVSTKTILEKKWLCDNRDISCVSSWQQLISSVPGIALSPHWCEINCRLCVSSCPWILQITGYCWTSPLCFINCDPKDFGLYIDGLVQERCNSSLLAMDLCLSCTNPSI